MHGSEGEVGVVMPLSTLTTVLFNGQTISIERAIIDYSKTWGGEVFDWSSGFTSKGFYPFNGIDKTAYSYYSYKNAIYQNWRDGSPGNVGSNKFGVNFWRIAEFEKGVTYNFLVKADDYYRIGAIPVNANQANQWVNISRQNWNWLNDAYDGKTYTFTPANTGKYWVYAGYKEEGGDASFALSWDSDKAITVEDTTFPVNLSLYDQYDKKGTADSSNIDPNKDTVVVIHGRGSGGEDGNMINLAQTAAASNYYPNSQVLYLDWKEAAKDDSLLTPPYDAAKRIRSVAQWATNRLKELGIAPEKTILLGHSLGSYVASEIGRIGGKVKELVALDPASSPGGTYDIDAHNPGTDRTIDFSNAATKSIALVASDLEGGLAGDNAKASSANDSYIVYFTDYKEHGNGGFLDQDLALRTKNKIADYHNAVVGVFSDILSSFSKLSSPKPLSFPSHQPDRYDDIGNIDQNIPRHEGRITADLTNKEDPLIKSLIYVDPNGDQRITWNS